MSDYIREAFDGDDIPKKNIALRKAHDEIERLNAENARLRADAVALQSVMERMREWESLVLRDRATVTAENERLRKALIEIIRQHERFVPDDELGDLHYQGGLEVCFDIARAALAEKEK